MRVLVIGGGIFGLAAAGELALRGHEVDVVERERIGNPRAASHDDSRALRVEYGRQSNVYSPWVLEARDAWRRLEEASGRSIYAEAGMLSLATRADPEGFELSSARWTEAHGLPVERLEPDEAAERFPCLDLRGVVTAIYNPIGGALDPEEALRALAGRAEAAGARIAEKTTAGAAMWFRADAVLVTPGPLIRNLLPQLREDVSITRHQESFFSVGDAGSTWGDAPGIWCLDIEQAGWYGFTPDRSGVFKAARCDRGVPAHPDDPQASIPEEAAALELLVRERFPGFAWSEASGHSRCYASRAGRTFLFDEVPSAGVPRLFVAGCGAGHAFKFGPLLGRWAADLVCGEPVPERFRLGAARVTEV